MSESEAPQVAWKAIEEGAQAFSSDGQAVGKVNQVVGDTEADVFTGLAISTGAFSHAKLVPSERVTAIWPDRVEIDMTAGEVEELPKYEDEPVLRVRPGGRGFFGRFLRR